MSRQPATVSVIAQRLRASIEAGVARKVSTAIGRLEPRMSGRTYNAVPAKIRAKIVSLYVQHGMATRSLATRFGIAQSTVSAILRDCGVPTVPGRREMAGNSSGSGYQSATRIRE